MRPEISEMRFEMSASVGSAWLRRPSSRAYWQQTGIKEWQTKARASAKADEPVYVLSSAKRWTTLACCML